MFVLLLLVFFSSCGGCDRYSGTSTTSVTVEPVKVQESSPNVIVPGVLIPHDIVEVKLPNAAKISEVYINKGDKVAAGTPLVKLAEEEINLKLTQLKAAKAEAESAKDKNSYLLKNRDRLLEEGKIDKTQYEGVEIENQNSDASLNKIKADIAINEYNQTHLVISSPVAGLIIEKYASPMQNGTENQVLFKIVNVDPILVSFPLTADESAGIKLGVPIKVRIDDLDNKEFEGTVSFIAPDINQTGKTFDVWAQIPNSDYVLKAGMMATAEFTSTNIHKVIAVPKSAIITRDRDKYVFTVNNGTARQTKVNVRNIHDDIAEISGGLAENDLVVVKGASSLQDGSTVEMWRR